MTEEERALAAEYTLGLLDDRTARRIERAAQDDADLGAEIAFWQEHLTDVLDGVAAVAPPPRILDRIETRLFDDAPRQGWLVAVFSPENRPMLIAILVAKAVLIAGIAAFLL